MSNQMQSYPVRPITSASQGSGRRLIPATLTKSPPRSFLRTRLLVMNLAFYAAGEGLSKRIAQRELNLSRRTGGKDSRHRRRRKIVRRETERGRIESVEDLRTELDLMVLRDPERLQQREVEVYLPGRRDRISSEVAE